MEIREAKQALSCRGCDKNVDKGEDVFHTYSYRCTGMHIYFCMACMDKITELREEYLYKEIPF